MHKQYSCIELSITCTHTHTQSINQLVSTKTLQLYVGKRWVLSADLKEEVDRENMTSFGSMFQSVIHNTQDVHTTIRCQRWQSSIQSVALVVVLLGAVCACHLLVSWSSALRINFFISSPTFSARSLQPFNANNNRKKLLWILCFDLFYTSEKISLRQSVPLSINCDTFGSDWKHYRWC